MRFFCDDYLASVEISADAWRDIVRNLRYAGFESVIFEEFTLFRLPEGHNTGHDVTPLLLNDVELFDPFGQKDKDRMQEKLRRLHFEPDRIVINQGDPGDSLFIIAEGAMVVEVTTSDGNLIEVARLGAGEFFGEAALLTGEPRSATVRTLTPSQILEITKDDIAPIIHA